MDRQGFERQSFERQGFEREGFERSVVKRSNEQLGHCVEQAKAGDAAALCAAIAYGAFVAPADLKRIFDQVASAWLGHEVVEPDYPAAKETVLPESFWTAFWSVVDDAEAGFDATTITLRAAALGGAVHPDYGLQAEDAVQLYAGCEDVASKSVPPLIDLPTLAKQPDGSLARELHSMWTDNGFDPEVLDRDASGLAHLSPRLRYVNTRILQMHDVWHLTMGYRTTPIHEIAISAFQLAQFGHNYSAMFLAVVLTITSQRSKEGFGVLMQVIAEAWQHGRRTPSLMAMDWEAVWHLPIADIRQEHGFNPFSSAVPADIF